MKKFKVILECNARGDVNVSVFTVHARNSTAAFAHALEQDGFYSLDDVQDDEALGQGIRRFCLEEATGYVIAM